MSGRVYVCVCVCVCVCVLDFQPRDLVFSERLSEIALPPVSLFPPRSPTVAAIRRLDREASKRLHLAYVPNAGAGVLSPPLAFSRTRTCAVTRASEGRLCTVLARERVEVTPPPPSSGLLPAVGLRSEDVTSSPPSSGCVAGSRSVLHVGPRTSRVLVASLHASPTRCGPLAAVRTDPVYVSTHW